MMTLLTTLTLSTQFLNTSMGRIAVHCHISPSTQPPIILLHGVYYDHQLWTHQLPHLTDRTLIVLDMPLHGQSQTEVPQHWTLDNCATMVLEILEQLDLPPVVGIGHSWGSMTLLRAAHRRPERFRALGFCNLPLSAGTPKRRWQFRFQHLLLPFRQFYTRQVAQSMYGPDQLQHNNELLPHLQRAMSQLSQRSVRQTDRAVILYADDGHGLLEQLSVPALALKGECDYVAVSEAIPYRLVSGGHVSPLEAPEDVDAFIQAVLSL